MGFEYDRSAVANSDGITPDAASGAIADRPGARRVPFGSGMRACAAPMPAGPFNSAIARGAAAVVCFVLISSCGGDNRETSPRVQGISVQPGLEDRMRSQADCELVVREADNIDAAADGLRAFREDLWKSQLFASLDGEFGKEQTPEGLKDIRYTPAYATEVEVGPEGPMLAFDMEDVLDVWPHLVAPMLEQLRDRLLQAGVRRAEIGWQSDAG